MKKKLIIIFILVASLAIGIKWLFFSGNWWLTLGIPNSRTIEDAKSIGTFLWEYEPDTFFVYDSIPVIVTSAFAERACKRDQDDPKRILFKDNSYGTCRYDTSLIVVNCGIIHLRGYYYLGLSCTIGFDSMPPDSFPIYVMEYQHHYDSLGNLVMDNRASLGYVPKIDTIQTFYLKRKY